ncbi:unnamed protein product [Musa hybrid cultivar]
MVGYKNPHPMLFPAPSPAIASSANKGSVCVHSFSVAANMGRMVKVGPWGGNGGNVWDMGHPDHITKLKIYYGDNIVGLETTYILNGNSHTDKRGTTTGASKEIILEEDEYFTSISGYFHALSNYQRHAIVMSLTLETNKGTPISVGNEIGSSFALTLEDGGKILGFFGRAGTAIDAIGIHCSLPN